jgi:RNA polymerase sigma-70 factor (ECF subfamily)
MREKSNSSLLPEEDAVLVKAFQAGDKYAFDKLVIKHEEKLFNVCYWLLGDYQEANDSAQDAFIKAYRGLGKFRSESRFFTWLYRIAVNTCKNKLRSVEYRQKNKMVRLDNPGHPAATESAVGIENESQSPVVKLEKKERLALLKKAINVLPPDQKTVVVLRDIEGLSYKEIASIAGLSLSAVKSRLFRGRQELRERLTKGT